MAAAWFVINPTAENSGSDKIATINCNNKKCVEASKAGCVGGDPPLLCNHPTFAAPRASSAYFTRADVVRKATSKTLMTLAIALNGSMFISHIKQSGTIDICLLS